MNPAIKPELLSFSSDTLRALAPYGIILSGCALGMLLSVVRVVPARVLAFWVTLVATAGAAVLTVVDWPDSGNVLFNQMLVVDGYSAFFNVAVLAMAFFTALSSAKYLEQEELAYPEYYLLVLFSVFGMMIMNSSLDLISMFVGLETMSLSVYTLVGFRRSDRRSNEAALKYFVLGGVASAILLYGTALLYGATGSTQLLGIAQALKAGASPLFWAGAWLVVAGFLFKVASVPFHMWMPDVYEGAPTPVTGFMTTALKVACFATFLRIFVAFGPGFGGSEAVEHLLWWLAVATMVIGNLLALVQVNVKRMLGYSSIAHTGYLLVGFIAGFKGSMGFSPLLVYLVSYSLMNLGAFVVLTLLSTKMDGSLNLSDLSGLSRRHPWLAFSLGVFMFAMAGVPPTAGFMAKYLVFANAAQAGQISLVVIGVLCSALSVFYYLRLLVYVYMRDPVGESPRRPWVLGGVLALVPLAFLTVQLGVLPARVIDYAQRAIANL